MANIKILIINVNSENYQTLRKTVLICFQFVHIYIYIYN